MKSVLVSRQKLLQAAYVLPPGTNPKVPRLSAPPKSQQLSIREYRTRRRYFQELRAVRQEVGESGHSSEDENYPGLHHISSNPILHQKFLSKSSLTNY